MHKIKRTIFFIVFLFVGVLTLVIIYGGEGQKGSEPSVGSFSCENCNVILISVDTLGAKHLGLYGYDRATSPFLDKISEEQGSVFENAIVQASWTLPSHAAMLTSQYPEELGMWTPNDALPPEAKTIAEALREHGFTTQAFSNGAFVQPEWGLDQGFDGFSGHVTTEYWDDVPDIFDESVQWLRDNKEKPFFLFIRPFHVHDSYTPSKEALTALGEEETGDIHIAQIVKANTKEGGPTQEDIEAFRTAYDGEVRELDEALKGFFQGLDSLNLSGNTIVILTADHGEEFGEHGTAGFHIALYKETIHVPLIFFLPEAQPQRISDVVEVRSIPATVLELLELPKESLFHGKSLVALLRGEVWEDTIALSMTSQQRAFVFSIIEDAYTNLGEFGKTIFPQARKEEWDKPYALSAYSNRWHLIRNMDDTFELYDVVTDKEEQNNLFSLWSGFDAEDRREILKLFKALDVQPPVPCEGQYCPAAEAD